VCNRINLLDICSLLAIQKNKFRNFLPLDGIWDFLPDFDNVGIDQEWFLGIPSARPIAVPSSWNELFLDTTDYIGVGWYQTTFSLPDSWAEGNIRLRFESVTYKATVWINGVSVCSHEGGHLPFEISLDQLVDLYPNQKHINTLVVRVENELHPNRVPPGNVTSGSLRLFMGNNPATNYDFFPYAGIDRSVSLYQVPEVHINDITVKTDLIDGNAVIEVVVDASDDEVDYSVELESGSTLIKESSQNRSNHIEIHLKDPNLWDPTDPFLYKLTTFIKRDSKILDSYNLNVGIRTIKVINNQILLNDKPIELKGFGRHEDSSVTGRGQNLPQSIKDHNLLKWTGANSYRTSHYPYSQEDLELADKNGFLVIGEIPAVGLFFDDDSDEIQVRLEKCRQQIDELIDRDKNHPSVIMWSVANEPFPPDLMNRMQSSSEEPVNPISTQFLNTLIADVRDLDDSRLVTFAAIHGTPMEWLENVDVVMVNRYYGWYFDSMNLDSAIEKLSSELEKIHTITRKPIMVSEFGADTVEGMHAFSDELYTEEYQVELLKKYLDFAQSKDFMVGMHVWVFADFRTTHSTMRIGGLNRKGVFTRDRKPKMAAHFLRSRWK